MPNENQPLTGHLEILIGLTVTQLHRGEDQPRKYTVLDTRRTHTDSLPYLTILSESGHIRRVHLTEVDVDSSCLEELRLRASRLGMRGTGPRVTKNGG